MGILVITVDLECCRCRSKITKVLNCLKEHFCIEKIEFQDKDKKVVVRGKFDAEKLCRKVWSKAGKFVKEIVIAEVWPMPPPPKPCKPCKGDEPEHCKPPKPEASKPKTEDCKAKQPVKCECDQCCKPCKAKAEKKCECEHCKPKPQPKPAEEKPKTPPAPKTEYKMVHTRTRCHTPWCVRAGRGSVLLSSSARAARGHRRRRHHRHRRRAPVLTVAAAAAAGHGRFGRRSHRSGRRRGAATVWSRRRTHAPSCDPSSVAAVLFCDW
ncbi:unnamed protein product [Urochloa humidicola]